MSSVSTTPTNSSPTTGRTPPAPPSSPATTTTGRTDPTGRDHWFDDDEEQRPRALVVIAGGEIYGIPVEQVREVVRPTRVEPVPGSPDLLRGIVNVRGAIVTVLDLQAMVSSVRAVTAGSVVLIEYGARLVGLAVESVRDVRVVADSPEWATEAIMPLDAVALCARHLLSAEERQR